MRIPLYQVDAFTSVPFKGNPAAICPLDRWLPDETMQAIALENNLAETAFFVKQYGGHGLRWFTPEVEVDLCGHATLAAAYVMYERLGYTADCLHFDTRSGRLSVSRQDGRLVMDFPSRPPQSIAPDPRLVPALGATPADILASRDYLCVFDNEQQVRAPQPDMAALAKIPRFATIATAPGSDADFVSRFFAPAQGVPEDPVTGSAHCTLIPYWSHRLGKTDLFARQISRRGGELYCQDRGDRVSIGGHAVLVLEGEMLI